ncbi:carboxymuconolactone decarboxylase family protein [Haliangium sp.]|uniref:carboxymuconolactone decarboxylase family protein n=1 Tax=Haliangium sp. TaxID=2663208 RepID=UPI003D09D605
MTNRLPLAPVETDDPALRELYDGFARCAGSTTPPTIARLLGMRPDIGAGVLAVTRRLIDQSKLPPSVVQLVAVAVSQQSGCRYCAVTHGRALQAMGVPDEVIQGTGGELDSLAVPPLHREILRFAVLAAADPNGVDDEHILRLSSHGLQEEEQMELMLLVALMRFMNTVADACALPLDPQSPESWPPPPPPPQPATPPQPRTEARFPLVTEAPAGSPLATLYQRITAVGFGADVPINWFTSMGAYPDVLEAVWRLVDSVLAQGQLSASVKQMIALTVSRHNNCRYCAVIHTSALEATGATPEVVSSCAGDPALASVPEPHRSMVLFAIKAAGDARSITDEDFARLRDLGLSDEELLEIVAMAAFTNFINAWADIAGIPLDGSA